MGLFSSARGVPDSGNVGVQKPAPAGRQLALQTIMFFAFFVLLHTLWSAARNTGLERLVIDNLTVKTAVGLINVTTPLIGATAVGTRIRAPGGGINILNGCEGTDALFLLIAAILASPVPWRWRLHGLVGGTLFVFVLNQGRILALFYANRHDQGLFDLLHGTVAPLFLIAAASLFFLVWMQRHTTRHVDVVAHA